MPAPMPCVPWPAELKLRRPDRAWAVSAAARIAEAAARLSTSAAGAGAGAPMSTADAASEWCSEVPVRELSALIEPAAPPPPPLPLARRRLLVRRSPPPDASATLNVPAANPSSAEPETGVVAASVRELLLGPRPPAPRLVKADVSKPPPPPVDAAAPLGLDPFPA